MATWIDTTALQAMLNTIKNGAATLKVHLLDDYSQGDDYATTIAKSIGEATIDDTDFTGPVVDASVNQKLTFDGKSGTATSDSTAAELHIAIANATIIFCVTNASNQTINDTNPIVFPAFDIFANQPTQI